MSTRPVSMPRPAPLTPGPARRPFDARSPARAAAAAAGLAVAPLYYAQPMLGALSRSRRVGTGNRLRPHAHAARLCARHPAARAARRPFRPPPRDRDQGRDAGRRAAARRHRAVARAAARGELRDRPRGDDGAGRRAGRRDARARRASRPHRRHGDDGAAARHPAVAGRGRIRRRNGRLARDVRARGRQRRRDRRRGRARAAALRADHAPAVSRTDRVARPVVAPASGAAPRRARAGAAGHRVQRVLVDARGDAARRAVPPRRPRARSPVRLVRWPRRLPGALPTITAPNASRASASASRRCRSRRWPPHR